jgi:phosphoglucomutase
LMFAEAAAWARARGTTLWKFLNFLYQSYGLYLEKLGTLTFEGAEGAVKIGRLLESYRSAPPVELHGRRVERVQDFSVDEIKDADGKPVPKEGMLMFHLAGGFRVAVRASGTEPKIKYYFFGRTDVPEREGLSEDKERLKGELETLWGAVQSDARARAG